MNKDEIDGLRAEWAMWKRIGIGIPVLEAMLLAQQGDEKVAGAAIGPKAWYHFRSEWGRPAGERDRKARVLSRSVYDFYRVPYWPEEDYGIGPSLEADHARPRIVGPLGEEAR